MPGCADSVKNGDESDIDCGGSVCVRCAAGLHCRGPSDCFDGVCTAGLCVARPTCTDGVRNGDESAIDCGGALCARCQGGQTCNGPSDCVSATCTNGMCAALANCTDGQKNGFESDVDCGGPFCAPCGVGKRCNGASDCASGTCNDRFLVTDGTWKLTMNAPVGWEAVGFNDSAWQSAVVEGPHGTTLPWGGSPQMPPNSNAFWIWNYDARNGSDTNRLSFRKTFTAPSSPMEFHISCDDAFTASVNGTLVTSGTLWFTPGVGTITVPAGTPSVVTISAQNNGGAGGLLVDARLTAPACAP